jgi:aspartate/methionine/tyrosine aminotransferase
LGYAALPATEGGARVVAALRSLASEIWSSASTPIQEAAVVAFTLDEEMESYVQRSARVHGFAAHRLYETLVQLGVPCPRPAGAFYLYPDFAPWQSWLIKQGISTSSELARYLLDEWDIATLPGSSFGELPEKLRLRLSTSMLYGPEEPVSSDERESALWELLAHAERLDSTKTAREPLLPVLEHAKARFTQFIRHLG